MYKNKIKYVILVCTKPYTIALSCGQCEHFYQSILRVEISTPLRGSLKSLRDANFTRPIVPLKKVWKKRLTEAVEIWLVEAALCGELLRLVYTSDGIGIGIRSGRILTIVCKPNNGVASGIGIRSGRILTIVCTPKNGVVSGIGRAKDFEAERSESFIFLLTPLLLQSLPFLFPSRRFTLVQNVPPIPLQIPTTLPSTG